MHARSHRSAVLAVLLAAGLVCLAGTGAALADAGAPATATASDAAAAAPTSPAATGAQSGQSPAVQPAADQPSSDRPAYRVDFEENGTYAVGVPIPTDQTLGDAFVDDMAFEGAVYGFDAEAQEWTQVTADRELSALDAYVVRAVEPTAMVLRGADGSGTATASAQEVELADGLNFVAAPRQTDATDAFGPADVLNDPNRTVLDPDGIDAPSAYPGDSDVDESDGSFERVSVGARNPDPANVSDGDDQPLNPFRGYFVAAENGSLEAATAPGATQSEASEALGVDADGPEPFFDVEIRNGLTPAPADAPRAVTARVVNTGPFAQTQDVELDLGGLGNRTVKTLTVEQYSATEVDFDVNATGWPLGTHTVAVESDDDRETVQATVLAKRSFDEASVANGTLNVTVRGVLGDRSNVTLRESFVDHDVRATLQTVTVDGSSVADSVVSRDTTSGSFEISLQSVPNGTLALTYEVKLPDGRASVEWQEDSSIAIAGETVGLSPDAAGETAPPEFDVEIVSQNLTSTAGASQNVTVDVSHVGGRAGRRTLTVTYGDESIPPRSLHLDVGERVRRTLHVSPDDDQPIGTYDVNVSVETDSATTEARVVPERTIQDPTVRPGESTTVRLAGTVEDMEQLSLRESVSGPVADVRFESASVGPVTYQGPPDGTAWDGSSLDVDVPSLANGRLVATYEVTVAESAEDGDRLTLPEDENVTLHTEDGGAVELPVHGDRSIDVIAPELSLAAVGLSDGGRVTHGDPFDVSLAVWNTGSVEGTTDVNVSIDGQGRELERSLSDEQIRANDRFLKTVTVTDIPTASLPTGEYDVTVSAAGETRTETLTVTGNGSIAGDLTLDAVDPDDSVRVDVRVVETDDTDEVWLAGRAMNGSFEIEDVPPTVTGNYTVVASAANYTDAVAQNVTVEVGETTDVDLNLDRETGSVAGVVEDDTDEPIADATVELYEFSETTSGAPDATETTNTSGGYALVDLPVGTHTVYANADGYEAANGTVRVRANETANGSVALSAETTSREAAAFAIESVSVSPDSVGPEGEAIVEADVRNDGNASGSQDVTLAVTDRDGAVVQTGTEPRVELDVGHSETVEFEVAAEDVPAGEYDAIVETANDTASAALVVNGTATVAGNVTLSTVDPDEDVTATVGVPAFGVETTVYLPGETETADFEIDDVELATAGEYDVVVNATNYGEGVARDVTLSPDETTRLPDTVALVRQSGSVEGTVTETGSDEPIEDATVRLDAFGADGTDADDATATDASGTYGFDDVPVGNHTLHVEAAGYENASASVDVAAHDAAVEDLELEPSEDDGTTSDGNGTASVEGTVALDHVDPDEDVAVSVALPELGAETVVELPGETRSADFRIDGVEPPAEDTYAVEVGAENYALNGTAAVALGAGANASLDLALERDLGNVSVVADEGAQQRGVPDVELYLFADAPTGEPDVEAPITGQWETTLAGVPVGDHYVALSEDGYEGTDVTVTADEIADAEIELEEEA